MTIAEGETALQTRYERRLSFNRITRFLHSVRYAYLAEVVTTELIAKDGEPLRILDIGCGSAKAYAMVNSLGPIEYVGIELQKKPSFRGHQRFGDQPNFRIINDAIQNRFDLLDEFDLVIALETLEHIPRRDVVRLVDEISRSGIGGFFCTVPNEIGPALALKNVGSAIMGYGRHKEYTWKETFHASTYQLNKVPEHSNKHKGFDWRILESDIKRSLRIERTFHSPYQLVPKFASPSLGFLCRT